MTVNRIIEDKELGPLFVRVNARARRLTFRTKEDGIYVTVPPRTSLAEIENAIEQLRPRLKAARQKQVRKLIDLDYRIDTEFFKLTLVSGQRERFLSRSELGEMQIICPPDADFSDEKLQAWLRKVIEEALRRKCENCSSAPFVYAFHAAQPFLQECEDKFQQWALGKLFGTRQYQPFLLSGTSSQASDRLRATARTGTYPRDESRGAFLGFARSDD